MANQTEYPPVHFVFENACVDLANWGRGGGATFRDVAVTASRKELSLVLRRQIDVSMGVYADLLFHAIVNPIPTIPGRAMQRFAARNGWLNGTRASMRFNARAVVWIWRHLYRAINIKIEEHYANAAFPAQIEAALVAGGVPPATHVLARAWVVARGGCGNCGAPTFGSVVMPREWSTYRLAGGMLAADTPTFVQWKRRVAAQQFMGMRVGLPGGRGGMYQSHSERASLSCELLAHVAGVVVHEVYVETLDRVAAFKNFLGVYHVYAAVALAPADVAFARSAVPRTAEGVRKFLLMTETHHLRRPPTPGPPGAFNRSARNVVPVLAHMVDRLWAPGDGSGAVPIRIGVPPEPPPEDRQGKRPRSESEGKRTPKRKCVRFADKDEVFNPPLHLRSPPSGAAIPIVGSANKTAEERVPPRVEPDLGGPAAAHPIVIPIMRSRAECMEPASSDSDDGGGGESKDGVDVDFFPLLWDDNIEVAPGDGSSVLDMSSMFDVLP